MYWDVSDEDTVTLRAQSWLSSPGECPRHVPEPVTSGKVSMCLVPQLQLLEAL